MDGIIIPVLLRMYLINYNCISISHSCVLRTFLLLLQVHDISDLTLIDRASDCLQM